MEKKEEKKKKGIRVANRQAWVDTFVYLCPQHRGGTGPGDHQLLDLLFLWNGLLFSRAQGQGQPLSGSCFGRSLHYDRLGAALADGDQFFRDQRAAIVLVFLFLPFYRVCSC